MMFLIKSAILLYILQVGFFFTKFCVGNYTTKEDFKKELHPMFFINMIKDKYESLK